MNCTSRSQLWRGAMGFLAALWALPSSAALVARYFDGDATADAYYDTDLGITWLADANAGAESSYDDGGSSSDGRMTWANGNSWAGSLSYSGSWGTASDWRLPTVVDTDGPDPDALGGDGCNFAYTGTDCGYSVDTSTGEMAHMYYDELGNTAYYDAFGGGPQLGWGVMNTGPFSNLAAVVYWTGSHYDPFPSFAWYFNFYLGNQTADSNTSLYRAWAVHPGDVGAATPVPVPAAAWLLGSGLIGLLGVARRRSATT